MQHACTASEFAVKTEIFEGPLELLLDLVERRKLLINDIALADVTDEYMNQVAHMQELSLPGTANFVALAATLLLIKSKSLLPILELTDEEETAIEDLEERLRLYQIYRNAAREIGENFGVKMSHEKQFSAPTQALFMPDDFCDVAKLSEAMWQVLNDLPVKTVVPKVRVKKVVSLEEMIDRLHTRISNQMNLRFSDLLGNEKEKVTVIVGFLAVLESVKQGSILVAQLERFNDIEIKPEHATIPKYS